MLEENTKTNLDIVEFEFELGEKGLLSTMYLSIDQILTDTNQPRKTFTEENLQELADSIRNNGMLAPILVRPNGNGYIIIAGERRYRASKLAGLEQIPCIIKDIPEAEAFKLSLIENLHREDLNPIDEAAGYQRLLDEYGWTHEHLAKEFRKSRSVITKILTINSVPEPVREKCATSHIPKNTIIEIAKAPSEETMEHLVDKVVEKDLSVRDVKEEVKALKEGANPPEKGRGRPVDNSPVTMFRKGILACDKMVIKHAALDPVKYPEEDWGRLIQAIYTLNEHLNGFIESHPKHAEG